MSAEYFSVGETDISTNVSYAVAPPGGVTKITFLEAKSFSSAAILSLFTAGSPVYVGTASAAGISNILTTSTTGINPGDTVLIRSVANGTFQRALITTTNSTGLIITNDIIAADTDFAIAVGDPIYPMTSIYSLTIGSTAKTYDSVNPILVSPTAGRPLLVEVEATGPSTNHSIIITGTKD
jgi:hypothetical protein